MAMIVRLVVAFIVLVLVGAAVWRLGRDESVVAPPPPADPLKQIHDKVAVDAEIQYGIAQRNGSAMDRCVQAGLAAAAQLQAKNEAAYATWKKVEAVDCSEAGVPR
jgi:hypothetical protein